MFKIGFGYDVHQLAESEEFILGGVKIEHTKGTVAHSDGDVLIHSICDALLGAANMRDIGFHFPDTSQIYKGIDSKILLKKTVDLIRSKGFEIGNIDNTICLQKPKIKDLIPEMISTLAKVMEISEENLSIKATTTEKLGFVGREEGISTYSVVLIYKVEK
jgi:2-C-methyl-D-erythritol 2,4-cyclodiphosphate synthase